MENIKRNYKVKNYSYDHIPTEAELIERWESLTITDDFIFCKVMEDEGICRETLEILLGFKVGKIKYPIVQKVFKDAFESRGIRLDVYTQDDKHCFDIEMQTVNKSNLLKRARYYSASMDADTLKPGDDFDVLKENYVIFLCLEAPFGMSAPVYDYETICRQFPKELPNDSSYKKFYNLGAWDKILDERQKSFLKYLSTNETEDDFSRRVQKRVSDAKKNSEYRRQFMTWEMIQNERFREGKEAGQAQAKLESAENLLKMNLLTHQQIATAIGLPLETIEEIAEKLMRN